MANDDKRSRKFWYREVNENDMETDINYGLLHLHEFDKHFPGHMIYVLWQAIQDKAIRNDGYLAIEMGEGNLMPMPWGRVFTYANVPGPIGMDMVEFLEGKGLITKVGKGKMAGCYFVPLVQTYIIEKRAKTKTVGAQEKAEQRSRKKAAEKAKQSFIPAKTAGNDKLPKGERGY